MSNKILVEVCCGSFDDAVQAQAGGAHRIELNSSLFHGGLTPSIGTLVETKKKLNIPVMVMVRPREGGFCYTEGEFAVAQQDARMALENGADGIVFGFLHADGTVDMERCEKMLKIIGDKDSVFHRAFDVVPDPFKALDQLIELGVTRIMTSGQESTVVEGTDLIRKLIQHAKGRIEILPGGGIRLTNIDRVIRETGCDQIHIASFATHYDGSTSANPRIFYGGALYPPEDRYNVTDREDISKVCSKTEAY